MFSNLENTFRLLLGVVIVIGIAYIISPFLEGLCWSAVIVLTSWPINKRLRKMLPGESPTLAALVLSASIVVIFMAVVIPASIELTKEIQGYSTGAKAVLSINTEEIVERTKGVPLLNRYVEDIVQAESNLQEAIITAVDRHKEYFISFTVAAARNILQGLGTVALIAFCSFFLYRDGDRLVRELTFLARHYGSDHTVTLLNTASQATLGVVYGFVLTALAQGVLAAVGFYIASAPAPLLLGAAIMLFSALPFGAPIIYLPTIFWMFMNGVPWTFCLGLLLWCICVVSTIDNFLRPIFLSRATNLSVLLSVFGLIGGLLAFGLIGLFLGPIAISLGKVLWNDLLQQTSYTERQQAEEIAQISR